MESGLSSSAVARYLQHRLPDTREVTIRNLVRIPTGHAQETWFFDAEWGEQDRRAAQRLVLRRSSPVGNLSTDRALEFEVLTVLADSRVPVPRPFWLETDRAWLGQPFLILERVDGDSSGRFLEDPDLCQQIGRQFGEVLGSLHRVNWQVAGLKCLVPPPTPDDSALTDVRHWEAVYRADRLEPNPLFEVILAWLEANAPTGVERTVLLWGDAGPTNILIRDGRIVALVDWELAHLGDPMDDLGILFWRLGRYLDRAEVLAAYESTSGLRVDEGRLKYYEVLTNLRTATMVQTGTRQFCEGRLHNPDNAALGLYLFRRNLIRAATLIGLE